MFDLFIISSVTVNNQRSRSIDDFDLQPGVNIRIGGRCISGEKWKFVKGTIISVQEDYFWLQDKEYVTWHVSLYKPKHWWSALML